MRTLVFVLAGLAGLLSGLAAADAPWIPPDHSPATCPPGESPPGASPLVLEWTFSAQPALAIEVTTTLPWRDLAATWLRSSPTTAVSWPITDGWSARFDVRWVVVAYSVSLFALLVVAFFASWRLVGWRRAISRPLGLLIAVTMFGVVDVSDAMPDVEAPWLAVAWLLVILLFPLSPQRAKLVVAIGLLVFVVVAASIDLYASGLPVALLVALAVVGVATMTAQATQLAALPESKQGSQWNVNSPIWITLGAVLVGRCADIGRSVGGGAA